MFKKLEENQYSKIIELFDYASYESVFAYGVVEKNIPGRIYVDDAENPQSALICSNCGKYLVIGDETNNIFNNAVVEFLMDKSNHIIFYDLYVSSEEWIEVLSRLLNGQAVVLRFCVYYYENKNITGTIDNIPLADGFDLKQIGENLFEQIANEFNPPYRKHFGSTETFCSKNFGFCITKKDEVVCVGASTYTGNGYAEIDIETRGDFYRQGLAFTVCKEFIKYCSENNLKAMWICNNGNKPSIQLADKLGFTKSKEIEMLWWHENKGVMASYLNKFSY